jgi:hypothetical protein
MTKSNARQNAAGEPPHLVTADANLSKLVSNSECAAYAAEFVSGMEPSEFDVEIPDEELSRTMQS